LISFCRYSFIAKKSCPSNVTVTLPWFIASAVCTAWVRNADVTVFTTISHFTSTFTRFFTKTGLTTAALLAYWILTEESAPAFVANAIERFLAIPVLTSSHNLALFAQLPGPAYSTFALSGFVAVSVRRRAALAAFSFVAEKSSPALVAFAFEALGAAAVAASGQSGAAVAQLTSVSHLTAALAGLFAVSAFRMTALLADWHVANVTGPAIEAAELTVDGAVEVQLRIGLFTFACLSFPRFFFGRRRCTFCTNG